MRFETPLGRIRQGIIKKDWSPIGWKGHCHRSSASAPAPVVAPAPILLLSPSCSRTAFCIELICSVLVCPALEPRPASSPNALNLALLLLRRFWINQNTSVLCWGVEQHTEFVLGVILGLCKHEAILMRRQSGPVSPTPKQL